MTHDLNLAQRFGRTFLLLDRGRGVAQGDAGCVLRPEVLQEVYRVSWQIYCGSDRSVLLPGDPR